MFVKPEQVLTIQHAIEDMSVCGYHIIITASLEHVVTDVLAGMPFKLRPKNKSGDKGRSHLPMRFGVPERLDLLPDFSSLDDKSVEVVQVVERTFLTLKPKTKSAQSVTQSTTEAVGSLGYLSYSRGKNPRRLA